MRVHPLTWSPLTFLICFTGTVAGFSLKTTGGDDLVIRAGSYLLNLSPYLYLLVVLAMWRLPYRLNQVWRKPEPQRNPDLCSTRERGQFVSDTSVDPLTERHSNPRPLRRIPRLAIGLS